MNNDRIVKLVYEILGEFDRCYFENSIYELGEVWINIIDFSYEKYRHGEIQDSELEKYREKLLYDYLINGKKVIRKVVTNFEITTENNKE